MGIAAGLLQDLHGGLIHADVGALEQLVTQEVAKRLQQLTTLHHPARQGLARGIEVDALELRALPIPRQAVNELGRGDECEQAGAGLALREGLCRDRRGDYVLVSTRAGVLQAAVTQHPDLRRDDVELLGGLLAHHGQTHAIVRAGFVGLSQVLHDILARQVRRQRSTVTACAGMASDRRDDSRVLVRLIRRIDFGFIEQAPLRAVAFDALALRSEALRHQQTPLRPPPFNLYLVRTDVVNVRVQQ